mmetsp:Transcript_31411/g.66671  ORF Transcript_31411/g.66671 Transcript_31411/m.66671 type:complete len:364 (-) Transcript_31411:506-1597(-)
MLRPKGSFCRLKVKEKHRFRRQSASLRVDIVSINERIPTLRLNFGYFFKNGNAIGGMKSEGSVRQGHRVLVKELRLEFDSFGNSLLHGNRNGCIPRHGDIRIVGDIRRPSSQAGLFEERSLRFQAELAQSQIQHVAGTHRLIVPREEMMRIPRRRELLLPQIGQKTPHGQHIAIQTRRLLNPIAIVPQDLLAHEGNLIGPRRRQHLPLGLPVKPIRTVESILLAPRALRTRPLDQRPHPDFQKRLPHRGGLVPQHPVGDVPLPRAGDAVVAAAEFGRQAHAALGPGRIVGRGGAPEAAAVDGAGAEGDVADHAAVFEAGAGVVLALVGGGACEGHEDLDGHDGGLEGEVVVARWWLWRLLLCL